MPRGSTDFFSQPIYPAFGTRSILYDNIEVIPATPTIISSATGKGIINFIHFSYFPINYIRFPNSSIEAFIDGQRVFVYSIDRSSFSLLFKNNSDVLKCSAYYINFNRIYFEALFNQQFSGSFSLRLLNNIDINIQTAVYAGLQYIV